MLDLSKKRESLKKIFFLAICIYYICSLITLTMLDNINIISLIGSIGRYFSYILFFLVSFFQILDINRLNVYSLKNILKVFFSYFSKNKRLLFMLILSSIIMFISKNKGPLIIILILWGASFFDFDEYIKKILTIHLVYFLLTIFLAINNLIPDITITRGQNIIRHSLGYIYPLEFMSHFLFIIFMYFYIFRKNISMKHVLAIYFCGMSIYKITNARTSFYILTIFLIFFIIIFKFNLNKYLLRVPKKVYIIFTIILFIVPIVLTIAYNSHNEILYVLNKFLSNRLYLGKQGILEYGVTFFGQKIEWVGFGGELNPNLVKDTYNFVDCWYIKNLLDHGIIYELCVLIGYIYIISNLYTKKDIVGISIIFSIMIVSILEPRLMSLVINPFILMMSPIFKIDKKLSCDN